jgi:hypothetical protein
MVKKVLNLVIAIVVGFMSMSGVANATSVGEKCSKVGVTRKSSGTTYTCKKLRKKLVWVQTTATSTNSTTTTSAPAKADATLWTKYSWTKPASAAEVIDAATISFNSYVTTKRSPSGSVKVIAQAGVDATFIDWITKTSDLVAKSFSYPALSRQFIDIIATDRAWFKTTMESNGFSTGEVANRLAAFDSGSPANGGLTANQFNWGVILKNNSMVVKKAEVMHLGGHEFFHAVQAGNAGRDNDPDGAFIPNWFWEGPAMFVGLQTANNLGLVDYATVGQKVGRDRLNSRADVNVATRKLLLSQVIANDPKTIDPYGVGQIATEFLVAKIGVEKMIKIYEEIKTVTSFSNAFKSATGVELADFYSMFEEVRATLGATRG